MWIPLSNTQVYQEGVFITQAVQWVDEINSLNITNVEWDYIPSEIASPLEEPLSGVDVTWSGDTFTFASDFTEWFSRRSHFVTEAGIVNGNMTYVFDNTVPRPYELPDDALATYRVESPPRFITVFFTITGILRDDVTLEEVPFLDTWTCQVNHDYDANITGVRYAVENSVGYQRYLERRG